MKTGHHQIGVQIKRGAKVKKSGNGEGKPKMQRCSFEGAFSRADQVGTGAGRGPERRERLGKELPEGLSECQA